MNTNKKILLYTPLILNIILILSCISIYIDFSQTNPISDIKGMYQSIEYLPDLYEYSFTNELDGKFSIKINKDIDKGRFEKYKGNIYLYYGENETNLISLSKNGFYFYDGKRNRVVEMRKVSDVPNSAVYDE